MFPLLLPMCWVKMEFVKGWDFSLYTNDFSLLWSLSKALPCSGNTILSLYSSFNCILSLLVFSFLDVFNLNSLYFRPAAYFLNSSKVNLAPIRSKVFYLLKFDVFYSILQPSERQSSSLKQFEKRAAVLSLKYGSILSVNMRPTCIFYFLYCTL